MNLDKCAEKCAAAAMCAVAIILWIVVAFIGVGFFVAVAKLLEAA